MDYRKTVMKYQPLLSQGQIRKWNELINNPDTTDAEYQDFIDETMPTQFALKSKIRGLEQEISDKSRSLDIAEKMNFIPRINELKEQINLFQYHLEIAEKVLGKLYS